MNSSRISFGDKVVILAADSTEGLAGQTGVVYGFTAPSQTRVKVVGDSGGDYAIAVMIEGRPNPLWLAENLVKFLDHQPGTAVDIGGRSLIRDERGEWQEVKV